MSKKRILLGASHSVIEPLGLLHLGGLARDLGWDRSYHLVKDHDFSGLYAEVKEFRPDVVGFNVYTGNHRQLFEAFEMIRKDFPGVTTVIGGPHPTYFPAETIAHTNFVVMSEGFGALRLILEGTARHGILPMGNVEKFPHPDRARFYEQSPAHAGSRIKSVISMTGCPYTCSYCYNSSTPEDIKEGVPPEVAEQLAKRLGMGGRLFPHNIRTVDDVINEGREIAEKWPTEVIYFQDDVHGFDINKWMPEFASRWVKEVGIPYHAQMRWEMTRDQKRLDILKDAGCFGLTLAIEAADLVIRREVLHRGMDESLMFEGMKALVDRGFRIRTEQITGLPYGATTQQTAMNLEADLQLVELNVRLRKETGGPTMAWASTLAPYKGTKLGAYCARYGHYAGDNNDVPDTFFDSSVLRFPRRWVGPELEKLKDDPSVWLDEQALREYREKNAELRRIFNLVTLVPDGHILARDYLMSPEPFSYHRLGRATQDHLDRLALSGSVDALNLFKSMGDVREALGHLKSLYHDQRIFQQLRELAPCFACLPKGDLAAQRAMMYAYKDNGNGLTPQTLSTAIRHHLYDNILYYTGENGKKEEGSSSGEERAFTPNERARISKV